MTERKQFSHLADKFTQYDYKAWAKGIQRGGYASSKKWSAQVLGIINKYDLNELDDDAAPDSTKREMANNE
jgi:flagellum-specific peptidoglycan hydrolase FlgJ